MRVLLAENPETSDGSIRELLEKWQTDLILCANGIDAVRKAYLRKPRLIILNVNLPGMNGYQCARLLKQDPFMNAVPIVHVASSESPLDRYWSKVCQGNYYLTTPVSEESWERTLEALVFKERPGRQRISHNVNMIPELEDRAILMMATSLLEQDLLRATILNEINMIDTWDIAPKDLTAALMAIIHSLFPFTRGAALLISDNHSELYMCGNSAGLQDHFGETHKLIIAHLWQEHSIVLKSEDVASSFVDVPFTEEGREETGEIYIHTKETGPIYSALFFENISMADLSKEEQNLLLLALDLVHGVLEKKIFARKSQELSVIDMATKGYSMTFFMEVLAREIANARRNKYGLTLITLIISNFDEVTKDLHSEEEIGIIRIIQNAIFRTLRKADIIARWKGANFAFLLTHTSYENAKIPTQRVQKNVLQDISVQMPSLGPLTSHMGMCEFDPEQNQTPESFFANAMPKKSNPKPKEAPAPLSAVSSRETERKEVNGNGSA